MRPSMKVAATAGVSLGSSAATSTDIRRSPAVGPSITPADVRAVTALLERGGEPENCAMIKKLKTTSRSAAMVSQPITRHDHDSG